MSEPTIDLDALLDGDEPALARALAEDPSLGDAVALQGAIDRSLRRAFVLPDLEGLHQRIEEATEVRAEVFEADRVSSRSRWSRAPVWTLVITAAAAIVLVVLLGQWPREQAQATATAPDAIARVEPASTIAGPPGVTSRWIDLYRGLPPEGFGNVEGGGSEPPDGASCSIDGSSALVVQPPAGLVIGSECGARPPCDQWGLSALRAFELSVEPQGERVLVFVYAAIADPRPAAPSDARFFLHRRQLGQLVLYELSPLPRPVGLSAFER